MVKQALIKEGWTITDDPLEINTLIADLEVDLGAEKIIAAEKGVEKIAVEIKIFLNSLQSPVSFKFTTSLVMYISHQFNYPHLDCPTAHCRTVYPFGANY